MTGEWCKEYFGEAYLELYSTYLYDKKQVASEVNFVIGALDIKKGSRILDVACGFGRHLGFFLRKGLRAFGLDLSLPYLRYAARKLPKTHLRKSPLVCGDMHTLPFSDESFDAVICLFNSFGYFTPGSPHSHLSVLREVGRILRRGGRFFLEVPNKCPVVAMVKSSPQTIQCGQDFVIHEMWDYAPKARLLYNRTIFNIRGKKSQTGYCLRIFTAGELRKLFAQAGMEVAATFGDYDGSPYSAARSPNLLLVGRRNS